MSTTKEKNAMVHKLLNSIAATLSDYRYDDFFVMNAEHINRWVNQFDESVQTNILEEIDYVFKKSYISKKMVNNFIHNAISNKTICGNNPKLFWENAELLNIQRGGNSQTEMNNLLALAIQEEYGFRIEDNNYVENYIYLDDAIFTGNKVLNDLSDWLASVPMPTDAEIHIIVIASHLSGEYYAISRLKDRLKETDKKIMPINIRYYRGIEDRKANINTSDVLRPVSIPNDHLTKIYIENMQYKPVLRKAGYVGRNNYFSSEKGRHLLEQEFLKAGVRIRSMCPHLKIYHRPLGNMVLETLGFGSMIVTYRNCPNNNPLALWAGDPWYPLLPRKVN